MYESTRELECDIERGDDWVDGGILLLLVVVVVVSTCLTFILLSDGKVAISLFIIIIDG